MLRFASFEFQAVRCQRPAGPQKDAPMYRRLQSSMCRCATNTWIRCERSFLTGPFSRWHASLRFSGLLSDVPRSTQYVPGHTITPLKA